MTSALYPVLFRATSCVVHRSVALAFLAASAASATHAQQVVKPPVAQAWIDVATFGGLGLPGFATNPMGALGSLFGGGGSNRFGQTQAMSSGRFVDVTLATRNNPQLNEAAQAVPAGFMSPALKLQSPRESKGTTPEPGDERATEPEYDKPKGRLLLYWGCGPTVRAGQPRIVDFANATPADLARVFQARRATQRGTHEAVGRPVWPSKDDTRNVPAQATLVGEHAYTGLGVPDGFKFQIPAAQDLMPAIALKQAEAAGATNLEWQALPTARAYFISAMGAKEGAKDGGKDAGTDMILWTSSEQPDAGFGLIDYQTNTAVDRWLKEQVLLAPQATRCTVPKGVFAPGAGAMLRMIAYGSEMNVAYPPRPADPKAAWEPQWAAKVRVKSVTTAMLGMEMGESTGGTEPKKEEAPGVKDLIKGIFGR
jgi:hypothetical protein